MPKTVPLHLYVFIFFLSPCRTEHHDGHAWRSRYIHVHELQGSHGMFSKHSQGFLLGENVLNLLKFSERVSKHADIISLTFWKVLTKFHTRGYLKIKVSHDEIAGNVLSWLGNWLKDQKHPEPTPLVTNSTCLQLSTRENWPFSEWGGKIGWRGHQMLHSSVLFSMFGKRAFTVKFFSELKSQVRRRTTWEDLRRIHVNKEVTDEPACWQR